MKDHFNYIEAYLSGKLGQEHRLDFENAMAQNADLRTAVQNYHKIEPYLDLLLEDDIRNKMMEIQAKSGKRINLFFWSKIAASILFICLVAAGIMGNIKNTPANLYAKFYVPPLDLSSRQINPEITTQTEYEQLSVKAHDLLKLDRPEEAEQIFNQLIGQSSGQIKQQTEWYLVMTALKSGDKEKARARLATILESPNHLYHDDALKLRKRLSGPFGLGIYN